MIANLASRAALCYNKPIHIGAQAMLETSLSMTIQHRVKGQLYRMDTVSPYADNGNTQVILIPLTKGKVAIVDPEDADLAQLRWQFVGSYARRSTEHHGAYHAYQIMHHVILARKLGRPIPPGMQVDHINGEVRQ